MTAYSPATSGPNPGVSEPGNPGLGGTYDPYPTYTTAAEVAAQIAQANQSTNVVKPSLSGFPLRRPGETTRSNLHEQIAAQASSTSPAGSKPVVVSESWDSPGVLRYLWFAGDGGGTIADVTSAVEKNGIIRIYIDDDTTPKVSMPINDFFKYAPRCGIFANKKFGRTARGPLTGDGNGQSGGFHYLYAPFQKYHRVEYENISTANTGQYWGTSFSLINNFSDLPAGQQDWRVSSAGSATQAWNVPITVCDVTGSGQLEAIWFHLYGTGGGDGGILEGDWEIYIDGASVPTWRSSGTEDAFGGSFYQVPVGNYPIGAAAASDVSGTGITMWRYFEPDPIYFNTELKIVAWTGQPNQTTSSNMFDTTVDYQAYASYWLDAPGSPINYQVVDASSAPVQQASTPTAGALLASAYTTNGSPAPVGTSNGTITTGSSGSVSAADTYAAAHNAPTPAQATGFWVETKVRLINPTANGQEAFLWALGPSETGSFLGNRVTVELRRNANANAWAINGRDAFNTPTGVAIGSGRDLTNVWVWLALKVKGTRVTAYYKFDGDSRWISVGSWTTAWTGTVFGVGSWTGAAEFTPPTCRPLKTVTS